MVPEEIEKSWSEHLADLIMAVRDKVRKQALEEAAKVAEDYPFWNHILAAGIRALKDAP